MTLLEDPAIRVAGWAAPGFDGARGVFEANFHREGDYRELGSALAAFHRDQLDWDGCFAKLERQAPLWIPGTASSYHAMTYGWLAGEIVRRVSGLTVGRYLAEEIAGPLAADTHIGLPEAFEDRVAEPVGPATGPDPAALMALSSPAQDPESPNRRDWRAVEIPAANGHASVMGLARLHVALVSGELHGCQILSPQAVSRMTRPAGPPDRVDMFLGFTDCWSTGVALNRTGIYGNNPEAYGHGGWGGSFGCADPATEVVIGYVRNRMGPELVGDPRTADPCRTVLDSAQSP